jgi:hypothetical protein
MSLLIRFCQEIFPADTGWKILHREVEMVPGSEVFADPEDSRVPAQGFALVLAGPGLANRQNDRALRVSVQRLAQKFFANVK